MKIKKVHYASYSSDGDRVARCGKNSNLATITDDIKLVTCKLCKRRKSGKYVITAFESF